MGKRADKQQAKYDAIIERNRKAEDRRQSQMAQHRGMSGHPSNPDKRVGFHEMSDRQLRAHGMIRTRGLFGTRISTMETHQDRMAERQAIARERKEEVKRKAKEAAKKAAKKALQSKKPKKKGFFSW